jgi:adenylate cyclase
MSTPTENSSGSRRLAAIWFADIVGFTRLSAENEPLALQLVETLQATATTAVESHGGRIVKFMGDGVMAQFASAEGAALGGMQLLLRFGRLTADRPHAPHQLRLGMHLGDVTVAADGDIYGEGVNRAPRLEGLAEPGKLLASEDVYRKLRNRPDLILTDLGTRVVKGYDDPIPVSDAAPREELSERLLVQAVIPEMTEEATLPNEAASSGHSTRSTSSGRFGRSSRSSRSARPIAVGLTAGIIAFVALGVWTALGPPGSDAPPLGAGTSVTSVDLAHADSFSIAVLPFRYLSSDEGDAYIADGISEELIHALSYVPELRVASRTSSFQYRNAEMDVGELAARLGVFMVIEGSVQKVADDLRVTAQLIDADHGGMQVWSDGWASKADDVLGLQENIAQAVVNRLLDHGVDGADGATAFTSKVVSTGGVKSRPTTTIDPEAHDLLLRGRYELARGTPEGASAAAEILERAVELAPAYARAHLALADAQLELGERGVRPLAEMLPLTRGHLEDALHQDPDLAEAHAALASLLGTFEWDWESAEKEFEAALALNPTPEVHRAFAELLSARGRHEEAMAQIAMAIRHEPGAVATVAAKGLALFRARKYAEARVALSEALRLDPTSDEVRVHLARTLHSLGDSEAARTTIEGSDPAGRSLYTQLWRARLRMADSRGGPVRGVGQGRGLGQSREDQLVQTLGGNLGSAMARDADAPYLLAALRLSLGDRTGATRALQRALRTPSPSLIWLPTDPMWDAARSTPQFERLVRRIDAGERTP